MNAVVFRGGRPVPTQRPEPVRPPGEARIRTTLAGICGTDHELAAGYMAFDGVPGHEFVGVVEEADDRSWIGRRVVGEINAGCGVCAWCARGAARHCPERTVLGILGRDGVFAERFTLPLANLHPVPEAVPDEAAVFAEPLAAAHRILEQLPQLPRTPTVVVGDGRLGQLCASVLGRAGARPLVLGRHAAKLHRLARLGFETREATGAPSREFELAIDATGSPGGLATALSLVRPGGTIVLKSTYHGTTPLALAGLVVDEIRIVGSRCGPFAPALEHLRDDPSVTDGLVTATYPLADAARAFEHSSRDDALKILLVT